MQFVVKFFPEITIKSRPVRRRLVVRLRENLRNVVNAVDDGTKVEQYWDKFLIRHHDDSPVLKARLLDAMSRVAGIDCIQEVARYPFVGLDDALAKAQHHYGNRLSGKTFAVRCKRAGHHTFTSVEAERYIGGGLLHTTDASGVNLKNPDVTVTLEISQDQLFIVGQRFPGLGGYPVGGVDPVLSLLSGGYDSPVASYLTMKRGMRTHFIFFNLGGRDQEVAVKEVAVYLWQRYGSGQRVLFISVPFEEVVEELLENVPDSYMGVVLKRMMLRVADHFAADLDIDALVTGEAVSQVSSQTVRNLAMIDQATSRVVLRPLIASNKADIIRTASEIGTEAFAANMPEYCGVISVNPTTRAKPHRVAAAEASFDDTVIERAIANAQRSRIDDLGMEAAKRSEIEVLSEPPAGATIIDIRHPDEEEKRPLLVNAPVIKMPFYKLHSHTSTLENDTSYLLYCDKGIMSRLHASHLLDSGFDVRVYRPD